MMHVFLLVNVYNREIIMDRSKISKIIQIYQKPYRRETLCGDSN